MPWRAGFVLLPNYVLTTVAFRSLLVASCASLLSALSALSAGAAFTVLFGLSVDYHVFVASRIRAAAPRGVPIRQAVSAGITRSAGLVASTAVVMISGFTFSVALSMIEMKLLRLGIGAAVFLAARIVRVLRYLR